MHKKNILMVHHGRCGSSVTGHLLSQNPSIHWASEIYLFVHQKWLKDNPGKAGHDKEIVNPIEILKNSMDKVTNPYYGCEISPFNFNLMPETMEEFIHKTYKLNFIYFILLIRKNFLRLIVSSSIAEQYNEWHRRLSLISKVVPNEEKIPQPKIIILPIYPTDKLSLLKRIEYFERQTQEINDILAGRNVLHLNYEDDIERDPKKAYLRICKFIGVQPTKVSIDYARLNPFPLTDMIENFDEVRTALHNTPYAWMLDC